MWKFLGYAAGKHYNMGGSGANLLCLPKNPEWKEYTEGDSSTWTGKLFGVEYDIGENKPYSKTFLNKICHVLYVSLRDQQLLQTGFLL